MNVPASLTSVDLMQTIAAWAEGLARALLADSLPRRWSHVQGVAARARTLKPSLGADADLIEAAAWLHDIGYLPELAHTGLHGLDGARYLRDVQHADPMLCRLVAHHSYAVIEAEERGLADVLTREFAPPPQPLADALTFCDMTTSPDGEQVQVTPPPGRDPRPLRLGPPGQPLHQPRHPAHPGGRRPGQRPSRPHLIGQWPLPVAGSRAFAGPGRCAVVTVGTDACRLRHCLSILVTCWSYGRIANAATGTSTRHPRTC